MVGRVVVPVKMLYGVSWGMRGTAVVRRHGSQRRVLVVVQNLPLRLGRRVRSERCALLDAECSATVICPKETPNEFNHRSTMNKTLEYMAHEVPIVATDPRDKRRCARDAAPYVPDGNSTVMAEVIAEPLDDPTRRRAMDTAGRERIQGEIGWSDQAKRYVAAFDNLVAATDHVRHTGVLGGAQQGGH
jgi:glycosyltransferase involved in cell wall biosynthesis